MDRSTFLINDKEIEGYVIPIGPVNLVFARTEKGLVGCGAVDALALEKFSIPAVKVRAVGSDSVRTIEDLLNGEVVLVNSYASALEVVVGMSGKEAMIKLS